MTFQPVPGLPSVREVDSPEPEEELGAWDAAVEAELRAGRSGNQGDHDVRAVQLRAANFSPAMIAKAGRLYHLGWKSHGPEDFEVCGESGDWYRLRVWSTRDGRTWFATCPCPARAGRHNRAGACAHRALAGYLRAELLGVPIPRWPDLTLEGWTS